IAQVQRTYWDLVFALRDQQNRQANLELTRESLRQIEARIAAGAAAPLARAEVETELANRESDVLVATQQVSIIENSLKQLLLRDPLSNQWSQSFMPTDRPAFTLDPINMEAAVKDAIENRHELRRLKLAADINEIDIDFFRNQTKPQIDLNGTFSLNGLARSGSPEGFETNLFTAPGDLILLNAINANRQFLNTPTLPQVPNPVVVVPPQPDFLYG